eukprot:Em0674g6a
MKESIESGTFRKSYTTEFKLSVVEWVESHKSSVRAAAKQFGVDRKLVRVWLEHKPLLNSALVQHGPNRRKLHCGRPPASQELDRLALDFLCEQKRAGVQVKTETYSREPSRLHVISAWNLLKRRVSGSDGGGKDVVCGWSTV